MNEAAPQPATDMTEEDAKALEVLRLLWEPGYSIGYDDEHGWWATRNGVIGHIITAPGPEELSRMLGDECAPVR
jgi:hypothetical protein